MSYDFPNILIFYIDLHEGSQFQQSLDCPILFFCLFFIYFLFPRHIRLFPCTPAPAAIHVLRLVV